MFQAKNAFKWFIFNGVRCSQGLIKSYVLKLSRNILVSGCILSIGAIPALIKSTDCAKFNVDGREVSMDEFNKTLREQNELNRKALIWLERAEKGDPKAQFNMGLLFRSEYMMGQAGHNFQKAADQGVVEAQYNLAYMIFAENLDYAKVVRHDIAVNYLRKAAEKNHKWAIFFLGSAHMTGKGVAKVAVEGFKYFQKAADMGLPEGCHSTSICYFSGIGTATNPEKAFEYMLIAAEAGHCVAIQNIANWYEIGFGTKQDSEKSAHWRGVEGNPNLEEQWGFHDKFLE